MPSSDVLAVAPASRGLRAPGARVAAIACVYLLAYIALDWASYVYPVLPLGITPWNPPPGLSLALLLRGGIAYGPLLAVAAVAADLLVRGAPVSVPAMVLTAVSTAGGYTLAAALLRRLLPPHANLATARSLGIFLLVTVPAALLVAVAYVAIYIRCGAIDPGHFGGYAFEYWIGDLNGILVLTPALLGGGAGAAGGREPIGRAAVLEIAVQVAAVAGTWALVVWGIDRFGSHYFYPLFLPLVWISARWGLLGALLALAALQIGMVMAARLGEHPTATFMQMQLLMLTLSITGLTLGAVVSHRRQVESSLRERRDALHRALRLASAGELASALAHELNQPMAALTGYLGACEVLARDPAQAPLLAETIRKTAAEAQRASQVVRALRNFYRRGSIKRQRVPVGQILEHARSLAAPRVEQLQATLAMKAAAEPALVTVDPIQIEIAIGNLLLNALDALSVIDGRPRRLEVSVSEGGGEVRVDVADNAGGIAATALNNLFEPFHTSKAEGMGLGLAIARSIVEAHGGTLALVETGPRGSRFRLTLPLARAERGA